jgi:hypothetical protein
MAEGIAELLAKHRIASSLDCTCGAVFHEVDSSDDVFPECYESDFEAHQAEVLAANGYGNVRESRAAALEDAADEFSARLPDGTGNGRAYNSYRVAEILRARAVTERGGE